jgi:putative heme-binding domain-containing protein
MEGLKGDLYTRRLAAHALGRLRDVRAVPFLLKTLEDPANDRALDHAYTFALIEIQDTAAIRKGLASPNPRVVRAVLAALNAIPGGRLRPEDVLPHVKSEHADLRATAWWIVDGHADWTAQLSEILRPEFTRWKTWDADTLSRAARWASTDTAAPELGPLLKSETTALAAMKVLEKTKRKMLHPDWIPGISHWLASDSPTHVDAALDVLKHYRATEERVYERVSGAISSPKVRPKGWTETQRLKQLSVLPQDARPMEYLRTEFGLKVLFEATPTPIRTLAWDVIQATDKSPADYVFVMEALPRVHPSELGRALTLFHGLKDEATGRAFLTVLKTEPLRSMVRVEQLKGAFEKQAAPVRAEAEIFFKTLDALKAGERDKLDALRKALPKGEPREGQQVFESAKANCKACHKIGYVGGTIGPDLTKIGSIRTEADLLEAVVYPSASFVRSYEPVRVSLKDGRVFNGLVKSESSGRVTLTLSATETVELDRAQIEELIPGSVSVMPAGLDHQLSKQELADLLAFLRGCR